MEEWTLAMNLIVRDEHVNVLLEGNAFLRIDIEGVPTLDVNYTLRAGERRKHVTYKYKDNRWTSC
jgi:hypothetical protein